MNIPNEGVESPVQQQEIMLPADLQSVFADSALILKKDEVFQICFLESNPLDTKKRKVVSQITMTPKAFLAFIESAKKII